MGFILFAPIDVVFNVRGNLNGVNSIVDVKWSFLSMHFPQKKGPEKEPGTKERLLGKVGITGRGDETESKTKADREESSGSRESFDDIYTKGRMVYGILYQILRLVKGILSAIHVRDLSCDLKYGLPDPADTGMLCGYLHTIASIVHGGCRKFHYSVTPQFFEEHLDVRMSGDIRFRIASFIPPLLRFIFSRKVLGTGWWFVKNRRSSRLGVSV
ncbi:MAG: DUF2953 domain-containing protein [Methanosarcinales archaeon]|nr:DUF2953 domain-containing protein [Methanosarcinales archaeon]